VLGALATGLLFWFLGLFLVRGFRFPVGPDAPVYLWWTRLAGAEGLSTVERPGAVALLGVLRGTGLGLPAAIAGAECALGVGVGLGAAAISRAGGASRTEWALAGVLSGTFATHLVAGYVSSLVFAVVFLAALTLLADRQRRSVIAAALLLGAGGLAHPLFFVVGAAIVLLAGALAFRAEPDEARRALGASLGASAILGAGWLWLLAGPPVARADTSQDAFLRRAGLVEGLAHAYRDRLIHRWTRYVEWASVPLAALGAARPRGWVRRALWSWLAVTVAGVLVGVVTGRLPPDRFLTFGYAIPILAAAGLVTLVERWSRRTGVAIALASALTLAMIAGAGIAWLREKPYLGQEAVDAVGLASRYASAAPPRTPWIFPVDSPSDRISFLATRLANVIRSIVPPDRIRDVYVVAPPPPPGLSVDERVEWAALARLYANDAASAARGAPTPTVIDVASFDGRHEGRAPVCRPPVCQALAGARTTIGDGVSISAWVASTAPRPIGAAVVSSTGRIALGAPLVLALLAAAGLGWSLVVTPDRISAGALAPAFGTATLVLGGVLADRLGLRLSGSAAGLVVPGALAVAGYLALVAERRRHAHPSP
jgi:hypothetical protein